MALNVLKYSVDRMQIPRKFVQDGAWNSAGP